MGKTWQETDELESHLVVAVAVVVVVVVVVVLV
jgi:hypothetical protein